MSVAGNTPTDHQLVTESSPPNLTEDYQQYHCAAERPSLHASVVSPVPLSPVSDPTKSVVAEDSLCRIVSVCKAEAHTHR